MLSLLYLVVRALVRLLASGGQRGRDDGSKDLEILVLRYQLGVLQRTSGRPKLRVIDRVLLAAASRALPRDRWATFLVTPALANDRSVADICPPARPTCRRWPETIAAGDGVTAQRCCCSSVLPWPVGDSKR